MVVVGADDHIRPWRTDSIAGVSAVRRLPQRSLPLRADVVIGPYMLQLWPQAIPQFRIYNYQLAWGRW